MISASEFATVSVQASLFTQPNEAFSVQSLLVRIEKNSPGRYDGSVMSLPIPPDIRVPVELVRASIESKDGRWRIELGPARINSFWHETSADGHVPEDVVAQCTRFLESYSRDPEVKVTRLALVITHACEKPNPSQLLIDAFCSEQARVGPLRNSASFELHNHKVYSLGGKPSFNVNSWVRCRTGVLGEDRRSALVVEQDINTVVNSEPVDYKPTQVSKFYRSAAMELQSILRLYFPESWGRR
jgi:hypothetical protein